MSDDTTGAIEFARSICSSCWYENEVVTYNVNGRCDRCNGTDWIDAGITSDQQVVILQDDEEDTPVLETGLSAREFAMQQTERLRNKHGYSPDRDHFFKD